MDDRFWTEIRAVAYRALRGAGIDHADADDAAQETMLELAEAFEAGEPLRNPAGWAAVVARRRAVDLMRGDRVRRGLPARPEPVDREVEEEQRAAREVPGEPEPPAPPDDGEDGSSRPMRSIDSRRSVERFVLEGMPTSLAAMRNEQVDRLVEALDERSLQMVWLKAEGLAIAEIADALDMKPDAVKKALQRMRHDIEERADDIGVDLDVGNHQRPY